MQGFFCLQVTWSSDVLFRFFAAIAANVFGAPGSCLVCVSQDISVLCFVCLLLGCKQSRAYPFEQLDA